MPSKPRRVLTSLLSAGTSNSLRYHQEPANRSWGTASRFLPTNRSGYSPFLRSAARTVVGIEAGHQPAGSSPAAETTAPPSLTSADDRMSQPSARGMSYAKLGGGFGRQAGAPTITKGTAKAKRNG